MDAPAIAVSGDGKKFAVSWMDMRSGKNDRKVFWSQSANGAFPPETPLAFDVAKSAGHPSIEIDSTGVLHAAWEEEAGRAPHIFTTTSAKDAKPVDIGAGKFPSLAAGKTVGIAYEAGDGVRFLRK